ncbi:MAG: WD40/YVTN/BNR-like repeat-containing protein, partial [Solirubrobacteraceae bacterium]
MLTDEQLIEELRRALTTETNGLEPRAGLRDRIDQDLASRPAWRARFRPASFSAGAVLSAVGAAVAVGVVVFALVVIRPAGGPTTGSSPTTTPQLGGGALQALSWFGGRDGWALAAAPCTGPNCAQLPASPSRLAHTTDGGSHWHALPDPPASLRGATGACSPTACVSAISFATPTVGYLYDPDLVMTTNGGHSWHPQPGAKVETLTVANGHVYRVAYHHLGCPGPCDPALQEAQIGSGNWRTLIRTLSQPGRSGQAQIVASGPTLLLAMYGSQAGPVSAQATIYRSINSGASWQRQADPCSGRGPAGGHVEEDLIDLAAAPGAFFAGLCSP